MFTYLLLLVLTISVPLAFSFEKRISYYKKFPSLFLSISLTALFMLIWDFFFTKWGIWSFNPKYLSGVYILNLPLEEILFFFAVPFSCMFIYESFKYSIKIKPTRIFSFFVFFIPGFFFLLLSIYSIKQNFCYTSFCSALVFALLFINAFFIKPDYSFHFAVTYAVSLIPFLIFNGILTGGLDFIDRQPVVIYSPSCITGFRVNTIPVEDFFYLLFMLLLIVNLYEFFLNKIKLKNSNIGLVA